MPNTAPALAKDGLLEVDSFYQRKDAAHPETSPDPEGHVAPETPRTATHIRADPGLPARPLHSECVRLLDFLSALIHLYLPPTSLRL